MQPFVLSYILNSKVKHSRIATEKRKGTTMTAIVEELSIEAAPQRVWGALTQQDEIVQWWANEARVKPEVGSLGEFRFRSPAGVLQFEVAELDEGSKVHWISRKGLHNGRGPASPGNSRLSRMGHRCSSCMRGS